MAAVRQMRKSHDYNYDTLFLSQVPWNLLTSCVTTRIFIYPPAMSLWLMAVD